MNVRPLAAFVAYGIEIEYMLADRDTLAIMPIAEEALARLKEERQGQGRQAKLAWSNEIVAHLLELKNEAPGPLERLPEGLHEEIRRANRVLEPLGAMLMPTGMHPWMSPGSETRFWPDAEDGIYSSYARIFNCRTHGWANLQSAQVNLPFADDEEFARLHAAVRLVLPIIPALAASSPIADGRDTGFADYRLEAYRTHPQQLPSIIGAVIPDTAFTAAQYRETVLEPMYRDIAPLDSHGALQHEWLNQRGAVPRFERHAIEIRLTDVQECPLADIAVAAAIVAAVQALYKDGFSGLAAQQAIPTGVLAGIFGRCIRDAEQTAIEDAAYLRLFRFPGQSCQAGALWRHIIDAAWPVEAPARWRDCLELILADGPLARRILAELDGDYRREKLLHAYRALCSCLADGRMFRRRS